MCVCVCHLIALVVIYIIQCYILQHSNRIPTIKNLDIKNIIWRCLKMEDPQVTMAGCFGVPPWLLKLPWVPCDDILGKLPYLAIIKWMYFPYDEMMTINSNFSPLITIIIMISEDDMSKSWPLISWTWTNPSMFIFIPPFISGMKQLLKIDAWRREKWPWLTG